MELILGSASPRRREILDLLNLQFSVATSQVDEEKMQEQMMEETPQEVVRHLSLAKSQAVARERGTGLVLGADTIVVLDNQIFGKPADEASVRQMMMTFSGKVHQVMTGVSITDAVKNHSISLTAVTDVAFREITADELNWYVAHAHYQDKAGGYAVQEHAALFVAGVHGCYYNVVGLPVQETLTLLTLMGYSWKDFQKRG
jgi:septum formation protein